MRGLGMNSLLAAGQALKNLYGIPLAFAARAVLIASPLGVGFVMAPESAYACYCVEPDSPAEALSRAATGFLGQGRLGRRARGTGRVATAHRPGRGGVRGPDILERARLSHCLSHHSRKRRQSRRGIRRGRGLPGLLRRRYAGLLMLAHPTTVRSRRRPGGFGRRTIRRIWTGRSDVRRTRDVGLRWPGSGVWSWITGRRHIARRPDGRCRMARTSKETILMNEMNCVGPASRTGPSRRTPAERLDYRFAAMMV